MVGVLMTKLIAILISGNIYHDQALQETNNMHELCYVEHFSHAYHVNSFDWLEE